MVFPYYPRPEDDEQEAGEEQQREESRRRFNRARFEQIRRRYERMRQRQQLQDRTGTLTAEQLEYQHDSEGYRRPASAPVSRPSTRPTPTSSPHDYADRPASQSNGQASSSDSGKKSETGSDKSEKTSTPQQQSLNQPSASGFPQDIEWSPLDEASGIIPFIQAAAQGTRDSSEDKTTVVCEALYAADPEAVARGLKFMTGCEPDEEQDVLPELISFARNVGMDDYLMGVEAWYTTRLGLSESFAATVTDEEQLPSLSQSSAKPSADEAPEMNIFAHDYLSETESGWDPTWMKKKELENNVLIPNLKLFIHDFDENAVNWDDFTLLESIDFYSRQITEELFALSTNLAVSEEYYQQVHAELDWATELRSLAEPKAVDYTEVYAESFGWTVHLPDAEHERRHVVDQLALIHEELNITVPDDYFESRSNRELKHDLAYLLQDEVLPFLRADENEKDNRIGSFYRRYQLVARDTPENVLRRLVSSHQKPDVVGFFFMMGFLGVSVLSEPIDWAATSVDVTDALLRGDTESAKQHLFFGAVPLLKSGMVRVFKRLGRTPLGRLMPARIGGTRLSRVDQRVTSVFGHKLPDDLLNRGYPEQVVRALKSDETTRPIRHRDRSRRMPDDQLETSKDIGSKLQNDVADFMLQEGYLVEGLGPNTGAHRMQVYKDVGHKPSGDPDLLIRQALHDGKYEPRYAEVYSPKTAKLTTLEREIRDKASRQGGHIVLNLQRTTLDETALSKLKESVRKSRHLREVIIIDFVGATADGVKHYKFVDIWTFNSSE